MSLIRVSCRASIVGEKEALLRIIEMYIYETHLHTCEGSACGRVHGEDYIDYMIDKGYSGIIVTDHFFNGNCAVSRVLPWKEKVEQYASGYYRALEASRDRDFTVMFGVEYNFQGDEFLLYGITPEWLMENERIMDMTRHELYKTMKEAGALVIQAHPYRERDYLVDIKLTEGVFDGIEIYNAANGDNMNALAYEYAKSLGTLMSAGSDIHFFNDKPMGGMAFDHKISSIEEFVSSVMAGEGTPVQVADRKAIPVAGIPEQTVPVSGPSYEVHWMER